MVEEARLEPRDAGLTPVTDGWFVVSTPEAAWMTNEAFGAACVFEGGDVSFPSVGFTLVVLHPGQAGMYHREANQENFLVLAGECLLLIEGEERPLKAWDFVHCPPDTEHGFVGAGNGPCVIFMTGAREGWPEKGIVYPRSELALRHGAGVEVETTSPAEAYAPFPRWQPGPPRSWTGLPWA
jgi:quercetin dioxygenase-like cupin family protein